MLGLKPWEYYRYTQREYAELLEGYELKRQIELDAIRWHATIVARVGGAKVKRPKDLMKLPLIDGQRDEVTMADMVALMKELKAKGSGG